MPPVHYSILLYGNTIPNNHRFYEFSLAPRPGGTAVPVTFPLNMTYICHKHIHALLEMSLALHLHIYLTEIDNCQDSENQETYIL